MTTKAILGIIPGLQATALAGQSMKMANFSMKPTKSYKQMNKNIVRGSLGIMAGTMLIKPTAAIINDL